ncbi:hypothetical protein LF1_13930 [Rubripirellula obstinata]|uniref:Uncharacterized protein n=1 Tax=Rubripirellula obstinata TaxID=406547 RepID=A0A5B1CGI8_9BACT|nr:hypothetical protein [Rubripirellula obstinata]KAA1258869.1 hypothetical protein LF1_13930 [Rubripirellula obstinata]
MTDPSPAGPDDTGETAKRPQQAIAISAASLIVMVVVIVGVIACCVSLMHGLKTDESKQAYGIEKLELTKFWLRGFCYGGVSGASWVVMIIRRRGLMFAAQAAVALIGAFVIEQFSDHTLARYLANTLGLVVFQTVGFHFFSPIQWQWRSRAVNASQTTQASHRNQFAIFDLIACTVAAATLFTLMQRVDLGSDAPFYWIVLAWVWIIMPLVSYCCFSMVRPQTTIAKRVSWFVLGLVASTVITILVSLGEYGLNANTAGFALEYAASGYARIMGGYMAVLMAFTLAASLGKP